MTAPKKPRKPSEKKSLWSFLGISGGNAESTIATGPSANTRMQEMQAQIEARILATFTEYTEETK